MTPSLQQRLSAAPEAAGPDQPVLLTPAGALSRAEALALGPAEGLSAADRLVISIRDTLSLVRVLMALDGHVGGLLLVSSAVAPDVVATLAETANCTGLVSDREDLEGALAPDSVLGPARDSATTTEWMMTTSGTTGIPKIVPHTLGSLARTVRRDPLGRVPVWGLVLDMTRFAGLQVALQSILGGGTLAVSGSCGS